jgi:hypothetical protein
LTAILALPLRRNWSRRFSKLSPQQSENELDSFGECSPSSVG